MLLLHPSVVLSVLVTLLAASPAEAALSVPGVVAAITTPLTSSSSAAKPTAASKQTLTGLTGFKTVYVPVRCCRPGMCMAD